MAAPQAAFNYEEASGNVIDVTGHGYDFAISGNTIRTPSGHTGQGLTQSANATAAGPAPTGLQTAARTWMTWIKFIAGVNGWILEFHRAGSDNTGVWGLLDISGTLRFRAKDTSGSVYESPSIGRDLGNWQHIAATHDGTNLRVYIDGLLFSTTPMAAAIWDADIINILDQTGANVILDDTQFFTSALSQSEIQAAMSTPVEPPVSSDDGTLDGSFSTPQSDFVLVATAGGTLSGGLSAPTVAMTAAASVDVSMSGSFSAPVASLTGSSIAPDGAVLAGQFSSVVADLEGVYTSVGLLDGSFSIPVMTAFGGQPMVARDIVFTIGPGTRPSTVVQEGALQRNQIGAGRMDKQWRNGSKQYIDFTVGIFDPKGELTLSDVEAVDFQVAVTTTSETPARTDTAWVEPTVPKEAVVADSGFTVSILHMYEATAKGAHNVWVKFGPTPEEPIYLATSFVVL